MHRSLYFICIFAFIFPAACSFRTKEQPANTPTPKPAVASAATPSPSPEATAEQAAGKSAALLCQAVEVGDYEVYKKQTFAIDFEPFRNSCFVTSHNPEYDDPPMESEFAIYKNGKKMFDFPSQFNGVKFGCWVDAVAFQDLNDDKLTDVIVIGKCQAKMGDYNENSVYINTGKTFTTREDANTQLSEKKTVKDVVDLVKDNRSMFFN